MSAEVDERASNATGAGFALKVSRRLVWESATQNDVVGCCVLCGIMGINY